jgi:ketosteroid isomerase-like protein
VGNVELGREVMAHLSRGEYDRLVELSHPDVVWRSFFAGLGASGAYRGYEGMRHYVDDLREAFEHVYAEIDDGVAVGDIAVLVGRIHFRGRGSGVETALSAGWTFEFRDGKVLRFQAFRDPEAVLRGIGADED